MNTKLTAAVEPLMEVSGARSSWLTRPMNSARMRSSSWSGARSCRVTTTETTAPSSPWIGVALTSVVALRPSGDREHDLLGAHRLAAAQRRRQRELAERDLAPVGAPERHHLQELLRGVAALRRLSTIRLASRFQSDDGAP